MKRLVDNPYHRAPLLHYVAMAYLLLAVAFLAFPVFAAEPLDRVAATEIRAILGRSNQIAPGANPAAIARARSLYAERDYRPIWVGNAAIEEQARLAREVLARADEEGLEARDYPAGMPPRNEPRTAREVADADVSLTLNLLAYAWDAAKGRLPPDAVYSDIDLPETGGDPSAGITNSLTDKTLADFLKGLPPPHQEYRRLALALKRYRAIAAQGGWPEIPGTDEVKNGGGDERLSLLKRRLAVEDREFANISVPSDSDLTSALKRYQARNGLDPDGRAGRRTLEMLNIPASERIDQIIANMERWRWLPKSFERRYIEVNAAGMALRYVEDGNEILSSRAIVGRPQSPTPIFRALVRAMTANPPWDVPSRIAAREILPKLKQDPNYLASEDMILLNGPAGDPHGLSVNWRGLTAANFPYRVRQLPGGKNALGVLKLELPNRFSVFLHDTPAKAAFERENRALSHGCIRVQQILPLAALALGGDPHVAARKIESAIASDTTQQLALNEPLPVYVLYWTAMAEADGIAGFRHDLYGRDKRLTGALASRGLALRKAFTACDPGKIPG